MVGATAGNIIVLLSTDFLILVLIAILVAFPLSWWAMSRWLNDFAYRVNIGAMTFVTAAAATILITILTIILQTVRAVTAGPVKSLRNE